MDNLVLKNQEIAFNHPDSKNMFVPVGNKPFVATRHALDVFGDNLVLAKLRELQVLARQHEGLDYLQVFANQGNGKDLWFIENGNGGAITALLPEDY